MPPGAVAWSGEIDLAPDAMHARIAVSVASKSRRLGSMRALWLLMRDRRTGGLPTRTVDMDL